MSDLYSCFPNLRDSEHRITSPRTIEYNCIAWAAGDETKWWWPDSDPDSMYFWPPGVSVECTLQSFVEAYSFLGFEACQSASLEPGYEKVALYTKGGEPQHAARQLPTGLWTSKCGQLEDIEHELGALEGNAYGNVAALLRRPTQLR